ncbi:testis-specific serine/threonine-protein kinase 4-like isoform X2 [Ornithodoros turicata]|uniref:testis-specific serine/threonine-protein kinase 4-like isoform X2 n=1 Tax=Ornithodoros turicata TaxID=34597 RepID=UPI0031389D3C
MAKGSQGDKTDSTSTLVESRSARSYLLLRSSGLRGDSRGNSVAATSRGLLRRFNYIALGLLGQGSYGGVYRAHSLRLDTDVAVKIVCKAKVPRNYAEKFLTRELQVIRYLRHQNVIRHLEVIESVNRVYIVMELAHNGSLRDYLRRVKRVGEATARGWFRHLVDGVTYLHNKGIVHRDLKCDNLLLSKQMELKIADFGFARSHLRLDTKSQRFKYQGPLSSTFCGSYAYASPELLTGIPYQPHLADIWSMGVILYFMTEQGNNIYDYTKPCKQSTRATTMRSICGKQRLSHQ